MVKTDTSSEDGLHHDKRYVYDPSKQKAELIKRSSFDEQDFSDAIQIKRGRRKVNIALGGDSEIRSYAATITVPREVWMSRWFGFYKQIYIKNNDELSSGGKS